MEDEEEEEEDEIIEIFIYGRMVHRADMLNRLSCVMVAIE